MGRALALELASRGCAVAIADIGTAALEETRSMLRDSQVAVSSHIVDVADRAAMERFAADVVLNTSSIFGVVAFPSQGAYNASKFAVRGFTEALRQELADTHIGVSCVQPGGVKTNIVKTSRYYAADNEAPTKEELTKSFEELAALTPHDAAMQILRGVEGNRGRVLVGKDAKLLAWIARLFPESYARRLGSMAKVLQRN